MDEAEHADRVAIMDHGKIVALDTPANLKGLVGGDVVLLRTSDDSRAAERLQASFRVSPQVSPEGLRLEVDQGDQFIPQAIAALTNSTGPLVEVHSASVNRPTLEDVFIKLTGRAIRDEELDAAGQMRQHGRMRRRAGMGGH